MKIWKLTPIDAQAPAFAHASRWHDTAFVRSSDSNEARKIAQQRLSQPVKVIRRFEETDRISQKGLVLSISVNRPAVASTPPVAAPRTDPNAQLPPTRKSSPFQP